MKRTKILRRFRLRLPMLLVGIATVGILLPTATTQAQAQAVESAWEELLRNQPAARDDTSISPLERRILSELTPEQAQDWLSGADSSEIVLANGESLDGLIAGLKAVTTEGLHFAPTLNCTLVDTSAAEGPFALGETRSYVLRGPTRDCSAAGGAAMGCGIPDLIALPDGNLTNGARAVVINLRTDAAVFDLKTGSGTLKVWPSNHPEPAGGFVYYDGRVPGLNNGVIVPICDEEHPTQPCASGDITVKAAALGDTTVRGTVNVVIEVIGYFHRPKKPEVTGYFSAAVHARGTKIVPMVPRDGSFCFLTKVHGGGDSMNFGCQILESSQHWELRALTATTNTVLCEASCVEW